MPLIIPNEEEGFDPVLLEVVMKPLDIDTETLKNEYRSKMEENKRKEEEKKKKTEKKLIWIMRLKKKMKRRM